MVSTQIYTDGSYLKENPTWHVEDSPWKAHKVLQILERNDLQLNTICEVGCGAGGVLLQLQRLMGDEVEFWGYDISSQVINICNQNKNSKLHFECQCITEVNCSFDLMMAIDLIEHIEDYFSFLRNMKNKSMYKIFHVPLDISSQSIFRSDPIIKLRKSVGHIHYFTKEIVLEMLSDVGYEIIDYFYTASYIDLPAKSMKSRIAKIPRRIFYAINQDLTVRALGGYSLMILAQ